jgi:ABC-type transport system substrate-binding protein
MNLHGDLAETWELPDPLTYVFHLRSGVHFHDGRPVTSADVKATFDHIPPITHPSALWQGRHTLQPRRDRRRAGYPNHGES